MPEKEPMEKEKPIPWTRSEIIEATRGTRMCGNMEHPFSGVSIDSRAISGDMLFVAIKGNVYDAHDFVPDVVGKGIRGLILEKEKAGKLISADWKEKGVFCVAVDDTTRALGDLAAFNRRRTNVSVIAITGSNGKTTTREMTDSVISRHFCTLATRGNLNNEIGLPLTLLKLTADHRWAVLELGMNHIGEISRLSDICQPDIGVITNVGPAHLEGVGSIEGVMQAKGELLEKIKPDGTAVLNADDPRVLALAKATDRKTTLFGISDAAEIKAVALECSGNRSRFTLAFPTENIEIALNVPGEFMVSNALAAATVAYLLGIPAREVKAGLESFKAVNGRMNILKTSGGINLIDDAYNANPGSMAAAIETLQTLKGNGRSALVAGDMLELGEHAVQMHEQIGAISARSRLSKIYITGNYAQAFLAGAQKEKIDIENLFIGSHSEILDNLTEWLRPGDWVLVKGSRAMGMEKIIHDLKARYQH